MPNRCFEFDLDKEVLKEIEGLCKEGRELVTCLTVLSTTMCNYPEFGMAVSSEDSGERSAVSVVSVDTLRLVCVLCV